MGALLAGVWMAVLLGLVVQGAIYFGRTSLGAVIPNVQLFIDVAGGVAWSVIVCGGVAIGTVIAKAAGRIMGLLGFFCAPLAFAAAKGVQRGLAWMTGQPMEQVSALTYQIGAVKAVEYALLGLVLGSLIRTPRSTLLSHGLVGAGFGAVFAAIIYGLNQSAATAPMPSPKVAAILINEMLFPLGCSIVIYWVAKLSGSGSAMERVVSGGG